MECLVKTCCPVRLTLLQSLLSAADIPYVIFDQHRSQFLPKAQEFLKQHGVDSIGRYGSWNYSSMENALEDGQQAAQRVQSL